MDLMDSMFFCFRNQRYKIIIKLKYWNSAATRADELAWNSSINGQLMVIGRFTSTCCREIPAFPARMYFWHLVGSFSRRYSSWRIFIWRLVILDSRGFLPGFGAASLNTYKNMRCNYFREECYNKFSDSTISTFLYFTFTLISPWWSNPLMFCYLSIPQNFNSLITASSSNPLQFAPFLHPQTFLQGGSYLFQFAWLFSTNLQCGEIIYLYAWHQWHVYLTLKIVLAMQQRMADKM